MGCVKLWSAGSFVVVDSYAEARDFHWNHWCNDGQAYVGPNSLIQHFLMRSQHKITFRLSTSVSLLYGILMNVKEKRANLGLSGTRPYYSHDGVARKSEKDTLAMLRNGGERVSDKLRVSCVWK